MAKTIVALYDNVDHAQKAVRDLVDTGIDRDNISLMANNAPGTMGDVSSTPAVGETSGAAEGAGVGAGIGAALGGIGGLLVGLGALVIPGIGPVVAAGPLAAALGGVAGAGAGAIAGGATGGLLGALTDMGVNDEQAGYYAEGIRRGGTLLTVRTDDMLASRAVDVMNRHNPIDVKQRAAQWRDTGWSGFDVNAGPFAGSNLGTTTMTPERDVTGPGFKDKDETIYGTTMGEKETILEPDDSESIYGTTRAPDDLQTGFTGSRTFDTYENDFRTHFDSFYSTRGYTYNQYMPAYHYGYDVATNERYRDRDWDEIMVDVRRDWESRYPDNAWEDFKDAIRHAWDNVRNTFR